MRYRRASVLFISFRFFTFFLFFSFSFVSFLFSLFCFRFFAFRFFFVSFRYFSPCFLFVFFFPFLFVSVRFFRFSVFRYPWEHAGNSILNYWKSNIFIIIYFYEKHTHAYSIATLKIHKKIVICKVCTLIIIMISSFCLFDGSFLWNQTKFIKRY